MRILTCILSLLICTSAFAQDSLQTRMDALSESAAQNTFELGLLQTLRAVEKTLQERYANGWGDQLGRVPLLRLQIPQTNPAPTPSAPDRLSITMKIFVADMSAARATLEKTAPQPFTLVLNDLWFDIDQDGLRSSKEGLVEVLAPYVLGRQALRDWRKEGAQQQLTVRFDAADHAWLLAYTHMLSGAAHAMLAFDPTQVLNDLAEGRKALENAPEIDNIFDQDNLLEKVDTLTETSAEIRQTMSQLRDLSRSLKDERSAIYEERRATEGRANRDRLTAEIALVNEEISRIKETLTDLTRQIRQIQEEIRSTKQTLREQGRSWRPALEQQNSWFDSLFVLLKALEQQPNADHITAAYNHWRSLIEENQKFWALLALETDNDREWIPNPNQVSALGIEVPQDIAEAWQAILADAAAVLNGDLLIPHPILPSRYGIHVPSYVKAPAPLNLIDWAHGFGAYPFAAKGPTITAQNWRAFQRLTAGNAGGFALFFN